MPILKGKIDAEGTGLLGSPLLGIAPRHSGHRIQGLAQEEGIAPCLLVFKARPSFAVDDQHRHLFADLDHAIGNVILRQAVLLEVATQMGRDGGEVGFVVVDVRRKRDLERSLRDLLGLENERQRRNEINLVCMQRSPVLHVIVDIDVHLGVSGP